MLGIDKLFEPSQYGIKFIFGAKFYYEKPDKT